MPRPRKNTQPQETADPQSSGVVISDSRMAQLERAVGILANYIVERDQLRYVGADADLVGVAREFKRPL